MRNFLHVRLDLALAWLALALWASTWLQSNIGLSGVTDMVRVWAGHSSVDLDIVVTTNWYTWMGSVLYWVFIVCVVLISVTLFAMFIRDIAYPAITNVIIWIHNTQYQARTKDDARRTNKKEK